MSDDDRAFDAITLQEKLIEPDRRLKNVTRNLQLGYIDKTQLVFIQHRADHAIMLESIPDKHGGYITNFFADLEYEKIDFFIVASNSKDGFGRRSQRATELKQTMKDESERSLFSSFKRRER